MHSFNGAFEERIDAVQTALEITRKTSFLFALIDPTGWTGLSMKIMAPLLCNRSAEVLVNVMTSFIQRFCEVESCQDSYDNFFGRPGVLDILRNTPKENREDIVVREYCRSLKQICRFQYVSSAIVMQPNKNGVKYFMVFATNSPTGIDVFKKAEAKAAKLQDRLRDENKDPNQLKFPMEAGIDSISASLREKYKKKAFERVLRIFRSEKRAKYVDVFCKALAMPLVTEGDLIEFFENDSRFTIELENPNRRKPSIKSNDFISMSST